MTALDTSHAGCGSTESGDRGARPGVQFSIVRGHVIRGHGISLSHAPWLRDPLANLFPTALASLLFASTALGAPHAALKKRVAVMDMSLTASTLSQTSPGTLSQTTTIPIPPPSDFALGLTEMLTTELAKTGRFIVLERKALADISAEQELMASGRINPETGARSREIIGAQALVRCAITEYSHTQTSTSGSLKIIKGLSVGGNVLKALVGIDTRLYDARTSEVLASVVARGSATTKGGDIKFTNTNMEVGASGFSSTPLGRASRQAIGEAVQFIIGKLGQAPWEARVIRVQGRLVYLNAGGESGVSPGERYGVYRSGEALVDPASGLELGTPDRQVATLRVMSVKPKYSVAEVVSGESPKRNDAVRPETSGENP